MRRRAHAAQVNPQYSGVYTPDTASAPEQAGLTFRLETFEWQVHQGLKADNPQLVLLDLLFKRHPVTVT